MGSSTRPWSVSSSGRVRGLRATACEPRRSWRRSLRLRVAPGGYQPRGSAGARSGSTSRRNDRAPAGHPPRQRRHRQGARRRHGGSLLGGCARFVVDCGGDLRVGGADAAADPIASRSSTRSRVERDRPATRRRGGHLRHQRPDLARGRPAASPITCSIRRRRARLDRPRRRDGDGPTAVEAETLAKAALLSGPSGRAAWLADFGGVPGSRQRRGGVRGPARGAPCPGCDFRLPERAGGCMTVHVQCQRSTR